MPRERVLATEITVQRLNNDPVLRDQFRSHWLGCERDTAKCHSCRLYSQTDYFNHNYRKTETRLIMPLDTDIYGNPWDGVRQAPRRIQARAPQSPARPGLVFKKATSACPYGDSKVTFIVLKGGDFVGFATAVSTAGDKGRYCKSIGDKIAALLNFKEGDDIILVAWPGKDSQDIFAIKTKDERDKALTVLGLRPQTTTTTFTAADGTVWTA